MAYIIYFCCSCGHYSIVPEGPYDYCTCGSAAIDKRKRVSENEVDKKIKELRSQGKKVY